MSYNIDYCMSSVNKAHYMDSMRNAAIKYGIRNSSTFSDVLFESGDFILIRNLEKLDESLGENKMTRAFVGKFHDGKEAVFNVNECKYGIPSMNKDSEQEGYNFVSYLHYIETFGRVEKADEIGLKIRLLGVGLGKPTISWNAELRDESGRPRFDEKPKRNYFMEYYLTCDGQELSDFPISSREGVSEKVFNENHDNRVPMKDREYVWEQLKNLRRLKI